MQTLALLKTKFAEMGARVSIRPMPHHLARWNPAPVTIDILADARGQYFDLRTLNDPHIDVLDVDRRDRHLLLMVRLDASRGGLPDIKHKFLCGHDERHWFVAAVPETVPVSTIVSAKEALKPAVVRQLEGGLRGKRAKRQRRRTDTFIRQGEWFFIPAPEIEVHPAMIHHRERLGSRKPHYCEELYRVNGETVYVNHLHPNGLTEAERGEAIRLSPGLMSVHWQVRRREPTVYVRGRVWHSDHATIRLEGWHRVLMNTENQSNARPFVAFLD